MPITRKTIIFGLPLNLPGASTLGSYDGITISNSENKAYVQMYLNPQSFNITSRKLINKQLTKGGYSVQYWGEDLDTLAFSGTTGSGGIEAINVIRSIYRHEQIQYKEVLKGKLKEISAEARNATENLASQNNQKYSADLGGVLAGAADFFTGGAFSSLTNGLETLTDIVNGDFNLPERKEYSNISNTVTLASLATSIEIYYGGEVYRGYFTDFSLSESAQNPGIFEYTTNFVILYRTGVRKNFMPWHRDSLNKFTGEANKASTPLEGQALDELTFPYKDSRSFQPPLSKREALNGGIPGDSRKVSSTFIPNDENTKDDSQINLKSVSRRKG